MLNREQIDKLKLIVEAIDDKLTKEGYIFTARHFDVVMDGMSQVLQQTDCSTQLPPDWKEMLLQKYNMGVTYNNELKVYDSEGASYWDKEDFDFMSKVFQELSGNVVSLRAWRSWR